MKTTMDLQREAEARRDELLRIVAGYQTIELIRAYLKAEYAYAAEQAATCSDVDAPRYRAHCELLRRMYDGFTRKERAQGTAVRDGAYY